MRNGVGGVPTAALGGSKVCTKCHQNKPIDDFTTRASSKDGLSFQCRSCTQARNKAYYLADARKAAAQRADNYLRNRGRILQQRADFHEKNPELRAAHSRKYIENNLERRRELGRLWARNNRKKINAYRNNRLATDRIFRHKEALRGMLRGCLARIGVKKHGKTVDVLGYTPAAFAQRMEVQFKAGMAWSNYGDWHIDHKIPVDHFMKKGELRPEIINALSNLQPLWAADNLRKRNSLPNHLTGEH